MAQHYWNVICVKYPDKPWERVQWKHIGWNPCTYHPTWHKNDEYRFLPDTIKVGDIELPGPLRVEPKEGDRVWSPFWSDSDGELAKCNFYGGYVKWLFDNGFLHATQEAAQEWLDYFVKLARGEG
jgi:hypothetical protein